MADRPVAYGARTRTTATPTSSSASRPAAYSATRNRSATAVTAAPEKPKGKSFGGFLGNLAGGGYDLVTGIVPGLYETGKALEQDIVGAIAQGDYDFDRTRKIGGAVAHDFSYRYKPLFTGNWGEFANRLYERPLDFGLDAAAVLTGGAALATKAGVISEVARTPIALTGRLEGTVTKTAASGRIRAAGQKGYNAALEGAPKKLEGLAKKKPGGQLELRSKQAANRLSNIQDRRVAKVRGRQIDRTVRSMSDLNVPYLKALGKVKDTNQRVATWALSQVPLRHELNSLVQLLKENGSEPALATAKLLESPKVVKYYENPTPQMRVVLEEARALGEKQAVALGLDPVTAEERTFLHAQLARGAEFKAKIDFESPAAQRLGITPENVGGPLRPGLWVRAADHDNIGVIQALPDPAVRGKSVADVHFFNKQTGLQATVELDTSLLKALEPEDFAKAAPGLVKVELDGKLPVDTLKAEYAAAGREPPVYMPDIAAVATTDRYRISRQGGGGGEALPIGHTKQNKGILFSTGELIMDPAVLNQSWLRTVKFRHYETIHQDLVDNATLLPKGKPLPQGWEYVRRTRKERIPHTQQMLAAFEDWAKHHLDDKGNFKSEELPFTSKHAMDALETEDGKHFLMVPKAYSRQLRGEFTRTNTLLYWLNNKPLKVWRALVLGLRPAWLVNNVLGNTLMYLMRSDPQRMQSLAGSFRLMMKPEERAMWDELMTRHFPEVRATFMGEQFPHLNPQTKATKLAHKVAYALPKVDRAFDEVLRKALVRGEVKKLEGKIRSVDEAAIGKSVPRGRALEAVANRPALYKAAGRMKQETRDFLNQAHTFFENNPAEVERIGNAVYDALGNFETMTGFERNVARTVFPFYAWFKAITAITVKMPLDHPIRTQLVNRLGQVAVESYMQQMGLERDQVPTFMQGLIPLNVDPDGRIVGLNTNAANPYMTIPQLAEFVIAVSTGKPGDASSMPSLNPLMKALIEQISGRRLETGSPAPDYGLGPLLNTPVAVGESLPQWRLVQAWRNKLYHGKPGSPTLYDRDPLDETLRFLGSGYARVSPERAKQMKEAGRG